jgi:hypothetical protein
MRKMKAIRDLRMIENIKSELLAFCVEKQAIFYGKLRQFAF